MHNHSVQSSGVNNNDYVIIRTISAAQQPCSWDARNYKVSAEKAEKYLQKSQKILEFQAYIEL